MAEGVLSADAVALLLDASARLTNETQGEVTEKLLGVLAGIDSIDLFADILLSEYSHAAVAVAVAVVVAREAWEVGRDVDGEEVADRRIRIE
jgi:hypothetical protein